MSQEADAAQAGDAASERRPKLMQLVNGVHEFAVHVFYETVTIHVAFVASDKEQYFFYCDQRARRPPTEKRYFAHGLMYQQTTWLMQP